MSGQASKGVASLSRLLMLFCGLALVACSTPYANPQIEASGESMVSSFGGIMSYARREDLRVVWLHGMCTHDNGWADNRHSLIAQATDLGPYRKSERFFDGAARVEFDHKVAGHALEMRYLVWSPLVRDAKSRIAWTHSDAFKQASLNRSLKRGLIDDCFADAVVYLGKAGDPVREWVRSEICDALGGSMSAQDRCLIDTGKPRRKAIFVAESLGSKILSDAIVSIWNNASSGERSRIAERLGDVQMVFLLANQIPLLNAASYTPAEAQLAADKSPPAADNALLDIFAAARNSNRLKAFAAEEPSTPLHFVAFTDPNDLLSYRLIKGAYLPADMKVTNIIVSNDKTYFGLLERPDTAHCGYGWNPAVIATVAEGYDGRKFGSIAVNVPHSCGLGG